MLTFQNEILSISKYVRLSSLTSTQIEVVFRDRIIQISGVDLAIAYFESAELKINGVIENIRIIRK